MTSAPSTPSGGMRRDRLWPIWGAVAGILGFTATVLTDTRPTSELAAAERGETIVVDPSEMDE